VLRVTTRDSLQAQVEELTSAAVRKLSEWRSTGRGNTSLLRDIAQDIASLRALHRTNEGATDWGGRSHEYRQTMSSIYTRAGVTDDVERQRVQNLLRHHVGNVVRERATDAELERSGFPAGSPAARLWEKRDEAIRLVEEIKPADGNTTSADARLAMALKLVEGVTADAVEALEPRAQAAARELARRLAEHAAALPQPQTP